MSMAMPEVVATGALVVIGIILLVLIQQGLKLGELGKNVEHCQRDLRWVQIWDMENRELRSALRAEREHVAQLQRKLELLQALVPIAE
jgi:predicted RNase H-like nuclease (RuvC/YqgF family)